jgi:cytochrome o ubiquinol oxidase subunit 2
MYKRSLRSLLLLPLLGLAGCNTVVMNPSGDIASQQADLIVISTALMLLIIVPVIVLTVLFAWRYRKGANAKYEPDWDHSTKLELVIWGAPLLIIIVLGLITWITTHTLDPYRPLSRIDDKRPLAANHQVLEVQVVALDWKWLFIYPEQGIATVNELVTPVDVPVRFKISASTVMNSFYVPELAGMIYAMPGMETQLNAVVNKPVVSEGFSSNFSGDGFSHMRFKYRGVAQADFDRWVLDAKASGKTLDRAKYLELEKPSERHPVERFATAEAGLFKAVVNRCVAPGTVCMDKMMHEDAQRNAKVAQLKAVTAKQEEEVCTTPGQQAKPLISMSTQNASNATSN